MDVAALCARYALSHIHAVTPLRPNTAAQVWRLDGEDSSYLLRTLRDEGQGELEWRIYCHLSQQGFHRTAPILVTVDGQPMAEQGGQWYQVQRFLPGNRPDPIRPGVPAAIARTVAELTHALADLGLIHGDLGLWNMVEVNDGSIAVIDFGEARPGDPYFDYAAALAGLINHTPPEVRATVCRTFLDELRPHRERLMEQLHAWAQRGLTQWPDPVMAARFHSALTWAEENLYEL